MSCLGTLATAIEGKSSFPGPLYLHLRFGVSLFSSNHYLSTQHVQEVQMFCALSCKSALDIMGGHFNEVRKPFCSSLCCKGLSLGCNGARFGAAASNYLCCLSPISTRLSSLFILICLSDIACSLSPWQYRC